MRDEPTMKASTEKQNKMRVHTLVDEKDFYFLIERRMTEKEYQLLETLKRYQKPNTMGLFR